MFSSNFPEVKHFLIERLNGDIEARPPHLLGGLVSELGGDMSKGFTIGSPLLTGRQDGAVCLTETGSGHRSIPGKYKLVWGQYGQ